MLRKRAQQLGDYSIFRLPDKGQLLIVKGYKDREERFTIFKKISQMDKREKIKAQTIQFSERGSSDSDY